MQWFLKYSLMALGAAAITIGLLMFTIGPQSTGNLFAQLLSQFTTISPSVGGLGDVNTDSEMRFYSVFWVAFGLIAVQTARSLQQNMRRARVLMFIFFMGGVARIFSILQIGMPHSLFIVLMSIELALPVVWLFLSLKRIKIGS